jgi:hypothetical protein
MESNEMLLPCPFCAAGITNIRDQSHWTGMRSSIISVSVVHWCPRAEGQLQNFFEVKAKTREGAISKWNERKTIRLQATESTIEQVGE